MDELNQDGFEPPKKNFNIWTILIPILAIIAIIIWAPVLSNISSDKNQDKDDEDKDHSTDNSVNIIDSQITGFEFSSFASMGLSMQLGETEESYFIVEGTRDFSIDDIVFVSSNESVAKIEFESQARTTCIYYKITPISEGMATLHVQTKDGSVKSNEISVSVYDPNNFRYEIVENYYISGNDSLGGFGMHCFVILKNTGSTNIYLHDATFDIEDSNHHLVASEKYVNAYPNVIAPGEKAVYYTSFSLDNGSIDETYKITPRFEAARAKVSRIRFSVTDTSVTKSGIWIKTTGRVQNTTQKEESSYYVAVFFYDKNDKLIGLDYTYPDKIQPGERIGFETSEYFSYSKIQVEDIARYEIIAYPNQYQHD